MIPRRVAGRPHALLRVGAVPVVALLAVLLSVGVAHAHPNVEASLPVDGAELHEAPTEVRLTFGAGIESAVGSIKVYDRHSERVDNDDAVVVDGDGRTVVATLRPDLPDGTYVIIWRAIGVDDGHLVLGQQHFVVGDGGDAAAVVVAPDDSTGPLTRATTVARAVGGAATVVAGGVALLAVLVLARRDARWRAVRLTCAQVVRGAAVVTVLAGVASIGLAAAARAGSLAGAGDVTLLAAELTAPTGVAGLARVFLLLPLLVGPLLGVRWYAVGAPLLAAATLALDGHGGGLAATAAVLHVLVVTVWAGGLVALVVTLRRAPADDTAGLGAVLGTFSRIAATAVLVAAATGVLIAVTTAQGAPTAVADTAWGRVLTMKSTLVVAALLLAAHTRFQLLPRLAASTRAVPAGGASDDHDTRPITRTDAGAVVVALRRTTLLESVLIGAALVASGLLGGLDPTAAQDAPPPALEAEDEDCVVAAPPVLVLAHGCGEGEGEDAEEFPSLPSELPPGLRLEDLPGEGELPGGDT